MAVREANAGLVRFAQESWTELQKVTWPERDTVVRLTLIVILISAVVAAYILGADRLFQFLVNDGLMKVGTTPTPSAP
jgi:preprotein translocase SecE subunit